MKKWTAQKIYAYIALIFGILFIFLTPPFQSPDEGSHFRKAYLVSQGVLYAGVKDKTIGNKLPNELVKYIDDKLSYIGDRDKKYLYSEFVNDQYVNHEVGKKKFSKYSTSSTLFVVYIPASVGILTSKVATKVLDLGSTAIPSMIYFARLFSLLVTVLIIYNAIRITPILKKTMTTVALMPMTVFLSSMITYDGIIISSSLLLIAYTLRLMYDTSIKEFKTKDILVYILLGFILFNYKFVYITLFIMLPFIPTKKFGSIKDKIIKLVIIAISIIGISLLFKIPTLLLPKTVDVGSHLVSAQQKYIKTHVFDFIKIVGKNIIDQRSFQLVSMIGLFGLVDTYLPMPIIFFYLGLLLVIALIDNDEIKKGLYIKTKLSLVLAISLSVFAIFGIMYIGWTPTQTGKIGTYDLVGVQGRYFIPLLFPFLLLLSNNKIKGKYLEIVKNNYLIVIVVSLIVSSITILMRFWI